MTLYETEGGCINIFICIIEYALDHMEVIITFVPLQYPAEGALDHMEMTKLVWECDYLLPNYCGDPAQEVVSKVGRFLWL